MTQIVYYPHAIYCPGILTLTQLSDVRPSHNFQDLTEFAAGQVGPQFTGTHMASPDNRFTTTQIKDLLDVCGAGEYNIARDLSGADVYTQYKAGENRNARLPDDNGGAGGNHLFARMQENAMICIESITARMGGLAEIRARLIAVYDPVAGNDPLVWTADNDITVVSDVAHLFTLGPLKLNGSWVDGIQEVELNNNIEYEEVASGGDAFTTYVGIKRYRPVLTARTRDASVLSDYGTRGTALSAMSWFLRKKLLSNINILDATVENILFAATTGTIKAREASGADVVAEVSVDLRMSAQNTAAYSVDTTSAIS